MNATTQREVSRNVSRTVNHSTGRIIQTVSALGLALLTTIATLGSLDHLAVEQHAATVLAKAAASQQTQASAKPASARS
jgi:hypothetical protein